MSYTVDPELLIQEIEKRPVIWDTNIDECNIRHRRKMAWSEVSSILIPSFNKETEEIQKNIIHELSTKWKTIRSSYISSRKFKLKLLQNGVPSKSREGTYHRQLAFLNKIIDSKDTESNEGNNQMKNSDKNQTAKQRDASTSVSVHFIKTEPTEMSARTDQMETDSGIRQTMEIPDTSNTSFASQQIISNINSIPVYTQTNIVDTNTKKSNADEEDEDLAFFYSLLPFVKTLDKTQRVAFRLQTMQLAQGIKTNPSKVQNNTATNSRPQGCIIPTIHVHLPSQPC